MLTFLWFKYYSNSIFQADVDNSGTIEYGEFVAAMLHLNKIQKEDHLFAAFSYFDKDGSGYITQDELQQACEKFGLSDFRLEDIMREVDQDNVIVLQLIIYSYRSPFLLNWLKYTTAVFHSNNHSSIAFQDGRIDYSEFVAMMQDTGFGRRWL